MREEIRPITNRIFKRTAWRIEGTLREFPKFDPLNLYCDGGIWGYQTATGVKSEGLKTCAVDPSVIPLGTTILVDGICLKAVDTGSAVKGNVIDIFYDGTKETSIVDALKSKGVDSSKSNRKKIAIANGIDNYVGTSKQNVELLNLMKQGKLIKP